MAETMTAPRLKQSKTTPVNMDRNKVIDPESDKDSVMGRQDIDERLEMQSQHDRNAKLNPFLLPDKHSSETSMISQSASKPTKPQTRSIPQLLTALSTVTNLSQYQNKFLKTSEAH